MKGRVSEIFYSLQGEGIYQGINQVFVRFYGCNLTCSFCDTKLFSYKEYSPEELVKEIERVTRPYKHICFTGGEPLLHSGFIEETGRSLKEKSRRIFLETNGTLPDEFERVKDVVDIVSMDFKLPSSTGLRSFWKEHQTFLEKAAEKDVYVKAVVTCGTKEEDIIKTIGIITGLDKNIPLVFQPEFSCGDKVLEKANYFRNMALRSLSRAEVIPQLHKYIGVR